MLIDNPWDWNAITYNPNLTMDYIISHPNIDWNFHYISFNDNITMEDIKATQIPWIWSHVSRNRSLTIEMVNSNINKNWYWPSISFNTMNYKKRYEEEVKRHEAALCIQKYWFISIETPYYLLWERKMTREYNEYTEGCQEIFDV